ncbi:hypothetical protein DBR06_SOUSAS7310040, partial [Sousa chinensis]
PGIMTCPNPTSFLHDIGDTFPKLSLNIISSVTVRERPKAEP